MAFRPKTMPAESSQCQLGPASRNSQSRIRLLKVLVCFDVRLALSPSTDARERNGPRGRTARHPPQPFFRCKGEVASRILDRQRQRLRLGSGEGASVLGPRAGGEGEDESPPIERPASKPYRSGGGRGDAGGAGGAAGTPEAGGRGRTRLRPSPERVGRGTAAASSCEVSNGRGGGGGGAVGNMRCRSSPAAATGRQASTRCGLADNGSARGGRELRPNGARPGEKVTITTAAVATIGAVQRGDHVVHPAKSIAGPVRGAPPGQRASGAAVGGPGGQRQNGRNATSNGSNNAGSSFTSTARARAEPGRPGQGQPLAAAIKRTRLLSGPRRVCVRAVGDRKHHFQPSPYHNERMVFYEPISFLKV